MKRIMRIAVTLVVVVVLAACGGDDAGTASSQTEAPQTEAPQTEEAEAPETSEPPEGDAELADQTLRLEDLPGTWNQNPPGEATIGALACLHYLEIPPIQERVVSDASHTFTRNSGMPIFNQVVMQFPTPDDAAEIMDSLVDEIESCSTFQGAGEATPGPVTLPTGGGFEPLSVGEIAGADQQGGWQMNADAGAGIPLMATLIVVQRGAFLSTLLSVNMGMNEAADYMEDLATVAVDRLA